LIAHLIEPRLPEATRAWLHEACAEVSRGVDSARFCGLISLASRHVPKGALAPTEDERAAVRQSVPGLDPERWTLLEAARVAIVLARADLDGDAGPRALEEA